MKSDPAASNGIDDEVAAAVVTECAAGETMSEAVAENKAAVAGDEPKQARKPDCEPPDPKVVAVKTEKLDDDEVQYLLKNPIKRPTPPPESFFERYPHQRENLAAAYATIDKDIKLREDIAKQYFDKGYAIVGVEHFDDGQKRLFSLAEGEAAAACLSLGKN